MRAILIVLLVLAFSLPAVQAQAPQGFYVVSASPSHQTSVLDEHGRGNASFSILLFSAGWVCAREATATMDLKITPFAKFAGASIQPVTAQWNIPAGRTGFSGESHHNVTMAWDIGGAPRDAVQTYEIQSGPVRFDGGLCSPMPAPREEWTMLTRITTCLPTSIGGPSGENCKVEQQSPTTPAAEAPAIGALWFIVSGIGAATFRRYHKK